MAIDTGLTPPYQENFPLPGLSQSSQAFRDNFSLIRRAIENIHNTSVAANSVMALALTVSNTGVVMANVAYANNALVLPTGDPTGTLRAGSLRYNATTQALQYRSASQWVPLVGATDPVFSGTVTIDGSLVVNGGTTTVNTTVTALTDPILVLGGASPPVSDDAKDRGVEFRWHDGSAARNGFFGFDRSTQRFTFIPNAVNTSEVFSGNTGVIEARLFGTANAATSLAAERQIALTGDVEGTVSTDLSGNVAIVTTARIGNLSQTGFVQLSNAVNSTSETLAATPSAVKQAYDLANAALNSSSLGNFVFAGNTASTTDGMIYFANETRLSNAGLSFAFDSDSGFARSVVPWTTNTNAVRFAVDGAGVNLHLSGVSPDTAVNLVPDDPFSATSPGRSLVLRAGRGGSSSGAGGSLLLVSGTPVDGDGASVSLLATGGAGTDRAGGNVVLIPGSATGSGIPGVVALGGSVGTESLRVVPVVGADRHVSVSGSNGGEPTVGTSAGALTLAPATGTVFVTGVGTSDASIELGSGRSADGHAYIDLHAQTGADYSTRIQREPGADGAFYLINGGTSDLAFMTGGGLTQLSVLHTPDANRYVTITGSDGGDPIIGTSGGGLALQSSGKIFLGNVVNIAARSSDPTIGNTNGDIYYSSNTHTLRVFANGAWTAVGAGGPGADLGNFVFTGNTLSTTGAGNAPLLTGGAAATTTSDGVSVLVRGGPGGSTSGAGGLATIAGGVPTDGIGGSVAITAADGVGSNRSGGNVSITAGAATGSGTTGIITMASETRLSNLGITFVHDTDSGFARSTVGWATNTNAIRLGLDGTGVNLYLSNVAPNNHINLVPDDASSSTATGRSLVIRGGRGGSSNGQGGALSLIAGTPVDGNGADVQILATGGVGTDRSGGNVAISAGSATGTGTAGVITMGSLVRLTDSGLSFTNDTDTGIAKNILSWQSNANAMRFSLDGVGFDMYLSGSAGAENTNLISTEPSSVTSTGRNLILRAGRGGSTSGNGGTAFMIGGIPTDGDGGNITINGAAGVGTNRKGGNVAINGGTATGNAFAGRIVLTGGSTSNGTAGGATVQGGSATASGGTGGAAVLAGGAATNGANAGSVGIYGGNASGGGASGDIYIQAGIGSSGSANGAVVIQNSQIRLQGLPSDPTAYANGDIWHNTTSNRLRVFDGGFIRNLRPTTPTTTSTNAIITWGDTAGEVLQNTGLLLAGSTLTAAGSGKIVMNSVVTLPTLASDPASGNTNGDVYYSSNTNSVRAYQNGAWSNIGPDIGSVLFSANSGAPIGYLPCNGAVYSKATYPVLSSMLGDIPDKLMPAPRIVVHAPSTTGLYTMEYGNGVWVSMAADEAAADLFTNRVVTSSNGAIWVRQAMEFPYNISYIRFCNGLFFAFMASVNATSFFTSSDGVSWTERTLPMSGTYNDVAYNGTNYVIVGQSGRLYSTPDLVTFTSRSFGGASNQSVAWNATAGLFALVTSNNSSTTSVYTSPTGETWSSRTTPTASILDVVRVIGGVFVAKYGLSSVNVVRSTDGITWTNVAHGLASGLFQLFAANDRFFLAQSGGASYRHSTDGNSWSATLSAAGSPVKSLAYGPINGVNGYGMLVGSSHCFVAHNPADFNQFGRMNYMSRLRFVNGLYIALNPSATNNPFNHLIYTSPDLTTWTARDMTALVSTTNYVADVIWHIDRYIILAFGANTHAHTTDFASITTFSVTGGDNYTAIVTNGVVAVMSGSSAVAYSTNGTSWTRIQAATIVGTGNSLQGSISTSGGKFFLPVSSTSSIARMSTDGIDWTTVINFNAGMRPVSIMTESKGKLYAACCSTSGETHIVYSYDGLDWLPLVQIPSTPTVGFVAVNDVLYVISGTSTTSARALSIIVGDTNRVVAAHVSYVLTQQSESRLVWNGKTLFAPRNFGAALNAFDLINYNITNDFAVPQISRSNGLYPYIKAV